MRSAHTDLVTHINYFSLLAYYHSRAYCEKSALHIKPTAQAKGRTFILVSPASYRSSEHHNHAQLVVVHAISDVSRWLNFIYNVSTIVKVAIAKIT
jgi:hypothetical protein